MCSGSTILNNTNSIFVYYSYVLAKLPKFVSCGTCEFTLWGNAPCPLIENRDRSSYLKTPTTRLSTLIDKIEKVILTTIEEEKLHSELFFEILYLIEDRTVLPIVGCPDHCEMLTKRIVYFYVSLRLHFICKLFSDSVSKKDKIRNLKKQAKLC